MIVGLLCSIMAASTPWAAPEPLEAVQHLRSRLNTPTEQQTDKNVPEKGSVMWLQCIFDGIEEKIKAHCKNILAPDEFELAANFGPEAYVLASVLDDHGQRFGPEAYVTVEQEEITGDRGRPTNMASLWNRLGKAGQCLLMG